jgi:hypothetical protein
MTQKMNALQAAQSLIHEHDGNHNAAERAAWGARDRTAPNSEEEQFWNAVAVGIARMYWSEQDAKRETKMH